MDDHSSGDTPKTTLGTTPEATPEEKKLILDTIKKLGQESKSKLPAYERQFTDFEKTVIELSNEYPEFKCDLSAFESQLRGILSLNLDIVCAKLCSYDHENIHKQPEFLAYSIIGYITGFKFGEDLIYDCSHMEFKDIFGYNMLNNREAIVSFVSNIIETNNDLIASKSCISNTK